jgi:hypothetical protein
MKSALYRRFHYAISGEACSGRAEGCVILSEALVEEQLHVNMAFCAIRFPA